MLAMVAQTPLSVRQPAQSLTTIASMLAPTGFSSRSIPKAIPTRKAHMRNNIVYHCCKFLQCDSEEPCE